MRIDSTIRPHVLNHADTTVAAAKRKPKKQPVDPVFKQQLKQVIKTKDEKNKVTEGELFAGVANNRVEKYLGESYGAKFRELVDTNRKSGDKLYAAARRALIGLEKYVKENMFAGRKDAAREADKILDKIADETIKGCQIDERRSIYDGRNTTKGLGYRASRQANEAYRIAHYNLALIDAASNS